MFRNKKLVWVLPYIPSLKPPTPKVRMIVGSMGDEDLDEIKECLKKGFDLEIILGNALSSECCREELSQILEQYDKHWRYRGNKFELNIYPGWPEKHGFSSRDNLCIEDPHGPQEYYPTALLVEGVNPDFLENYFLRYFREYKKSSVLADVNFLRGMPLLQF